MKNKLASLSIMLTFVAVAAAQTAIKKYDIKSGIITFQNDITMGTMQLKTKVIVYFDDYGMKECKETYTEDKLKSGTFSDEKNIYILFPNRKVAMKQGAAYRGTEVRVDRNEFGSKKTGMMGRSRKRPR